MASVAGRKKSIISNTTIQIDQPIANNSIINKAPGQHVSLYQQCSSLRSKLARIQQFSPWFQIAASPNSRQSTDPVTQLWDVFSLGVPLCCIYNLQPPLGKPIDVETNPAAFDPTNERVKKHSIMLFALQIKNVPDCLTFTVTDLWDRNSNDGLVKVVKTVTTLVNAFPDSMFDLPPPSPPVPSLSTASLESLPVPPTPVPGGKEAARFNIIKETLDTERRYVAELETMQMYAQELSQGGLIDQDSIHLMFPNLNKLLNFQRRFLIRLESTAEVPWPEQHWGLHFIENEEEFAVYEPYCANYTNAADLVLSLADNLIAQSQLINAKTELPAFLIKPVQRICKYPLLLESLMKASSPEDYPLYDELKEGVAAAKRIADKINEAQRRAENMQTVKNLQGRIEDWKGHHLSGFGDLLLDDVFLVMKSDVDRDYHVFLFERIILCCKDAPTGAGPAGKKVNKTNSILKKQTPVASPVLGANLARQKNTPLLLKGRIFLSNVTQAVPASQRHSTPMSSAVPNSLEVWWQGDDDMEFFTLRCRTEEQMRQWETTINRLIRENSDRRFSSRGSSRMMVHASSMSAPRQSISTTSSQTYIESLPSRPSSSAHVRKNLVPNGSEEQIAPTPNGLYNGPNGYPPHDDEGFDFDDEYEDYPPSSYPPSGRETPMSMPRRMTSHITVDRDSQYAFPERPRARTEDHNGPNMTQWRSQQNGMPPPPLPHPYGSQHPAALAVGVAGAVRPPVPRMQSNQSAASFNSTASGDSFGVGVKPRLRSQFSSTRLKSSYEAGEVYSNGVPHGQNLPPSIQRSRSASQPSAYIPRPVDPPPPVPSLPQAPWLQQRGANGNENKRGSGSSESTAASSDDSPNSSSPITPYASSESSLGGIPVNSSFKNHNFDNAPTPTASLMPGGIKIKVHFNEDIFLVQLPRDAEYEALVERVTKKIRLCGGRRDEGPLRLKYRDEDGDLVSLGSTEDVQMAFEALRPGGQVTLYVA